MACLHICGIHLKLCQVLAPSARIRDGTRQRQAWSPPKRTDAVAEGVLGLSAEGGRG